MEESRRSFVSIGPPANRVVSFSCTMEIFFGSRVQAYSHATRRDVYVHVLTCIPTYVRTYANLCVPDGEAHAK